MDALVAVRARIASAVLARRTPVDAALGAVTLRPHQVEAAQRLLAALDQFGGALLADAPGLGKTFVALAVARARGGAIVAAPAALRAQWLSSARRARVAVRFVSLEALSRRAASVRNERLLIVDEAHHLRNPGAARYGRAASLALGREVLLISATPVHNRREDRDAVLALFLGARAAALPDRDVARLVVRRDADATLVPMLAPVEWARLPPARGIAAALRTLPPPLPAHDGRVAAALTRQGLALAWASSVAALGATARRAAHRAAALDDALAAGRWPTRAELRAWTIGDDASQLVMAGLFDESADRDLPLARQHLLAHRHALDALRAACRARERADTDARAAWLVRLMHRHRTECIVAFSRFEATITALWRALRHLPGVVAVSARGVRSAGGGMDRRTLLAMLSESEPLDAACPLHLVLATDLLGEGVDLRLASVIVHLDQPWTPARATQREGRAARLGARHARVAVYALHPPAAAERLLAMPARLARKHGQLIESLAPAVAREALVDLVRPWADARGEAAHRQSASNGTRLSAGLGARLGARLGVASTDRWLRDRVAAVRGDPAGWVAAIRAPDGSVQLLAARAGHQPRDDDAVAVALLRGASNDALAVDAALVRAARRAIAEWSARQWSRALAVSADEPQRRRIIRLLDHLLEMAPLNERAALQWRAARVLAVLCGLRGAGMDSLLAEAPTTASADALLGWLESVTLPLARPREERPRPAGARVLALLVLT